MEARHLNTVRLSIKSSRQVKLPLRDALLFALNGLAATGVHYGALRLLVDGFDARPVGLANFFAASIGIVFSFLGNRYVVFRTRSNGSLLDRFLRFLLLYASLAILSALVLFVWTDLRGRSYHIGFVLATVFQFILSYFGNRYLVFRK